MATVQRFLIVNAAGDCRLAAKKPKQLSRDSVAYELNVELPPDWGQMAGKIDLKLPGPPVVTPATTLDEIADRARRAKASA